MPRTFSSTGARLTTLNRTFAFDWQALAGPARHVAGMKKLLSVALIAAAALAAGAPAASAATREYEGTVVSVDRDSRTFRLRDSERGTVRIKVTSNTRFERVTLRRPARRPEQHRGHRPPLQRPLGRASRSSAQAAAATTATTTARRRRPGTRRRRRAWGPRARGAAACRGPAHRGLGAQRRTRSRGGTAPLPPSTREASSDGDHRREPLGHRREVAAEDDRLRAQQVHDGAERDAQPAPAVGQRGQRRRRRRSWARRTSSATGLPEPRVVHGLAVEARGREQRLQARARLQAPARAARARAARRPRPSCGRTRRRTRGSRGTARRRGRCRRRRRSRPRRTRSRCTRSRRPPTARPARRGWPRCRRRAAARASSMRSRSSSTTGDVLPVQVRRDQQRAVLDVDQAGQRDGRADRAQALRPHLVQRALRVSSPRRRTRPPRRGRGCRPPPSPCSASRRRGRWPARRGSRR